MRATKEDIEQIYRLILGRDADAADYDFWLPIICEHSITPQEFARIATNSEEYFLKYGAVDLHKGYKKLAALASRSISMQEDRRVDVRDRIFWTRYISSSVKRDFQEHLVSSPLLLGDAPSPLPFREIGFQQYLTDRGIVIRSMLATFELSLLYALARDYWSGWGKIADLGCTYGLTTRCFAKGLADNNRIEEFAKAKVIYAFDLFLVDVLDGYTSPSETLHSGSTFADFLALNNDMLRYIAPCPGDISRMAWAAPLEILFVDCAKSWQLNQWIIERMFPWLREGSILVQQDYIHFNEYWVHITMEHFAEYFEPLYMLYGASSVYRCKRSIDPEVVTVDLASLPLARKEEMLAAAMNKAPVPVREVIKCAYAKCLLDHREVSRAKEMIESVVTEPLTEDPILNVAGIAASNKEIVRGMILATGDLDSGKYPKIDG